MMTLLKKLVSLDEPNNVQKISHTLAMLTADIGHYHIQEKQQHIL
jgi:hypothetical protein